MGILSVAFEGFFGPFPALASFQSSFNCFCPEITLTFCWSLQTEMCFCSIIFPMENEQLLEKRFFLVERL